MSFALGPLLAHMMQGGDQPAAAAPAAAPPEQRPLLKDAIQAAPPQAAPAQPAAPSFIQKVQDFSKNHQASGGMDQNDIAGSIFRSFGIKREF